MTDPTEIGPGEFHPAARLAYRWLKGLMVTSPEAYVQIRTALSIAAEDGNRQAQICMGTIQRLKDSKPVSDRYLLGLAWTIISVLNFKYMERVAAERWDPAYGPDDTEFDYEEGTIEA